MIEVPRGALTADEIANTAEFFSFGTNDLAQTCLGMSRDDFGDSCPLRWWLRKSPLTRRQDPMPLAGWLDQSTSQPEQPDRIRAWLRR